MAKAKKKENLTPEERLQAALVPDWEQPYKLPGNWCWTRMQEIAQWGSGGTPSRKIPEYYNGDIPWIKTGELNDDYIFETEEHITQEAIFHSSAKLFPLHTVVIAMYGATIGKVAILGIPATTNQACACGIANTSTNYKYLFYYARSQKDDFIKKGKGGAQPNISQEIIKFHEFPLPPFSEQQRIVDRIENLFAKLDKAKQKAQDALDSFETRKAAILHKAFTGELTAQWRKEHGVGMESWEDSTVGKICQDIKVGIVIKPSQYYTNEKQGTPAFRSANVRENYINDFDWVYLNQDGMEKNTRSIVHTGDVLVVRSGNPGTACVVSSKFDGYNAIDILIAVPDHSRVISEFLCAYTNSPLGKRLITENKRGMALAHFNVKGYSGLPIRVPLLEEQTEIVQCLDNLLSKEQQAKKVTESMLEQIDDVKKTILIRAFHGELGTNDPNEESSVELLKRVLAEDKHIITKRRCKSIPVELKNKLETELEQKIIRLYSQQSTKSLPAEEIISVSAKKFEIMEALNNLEKRGIIKKMDNGRYKLLG